MRTPAILLCFFLAFCPLSVGTPLKCPPPFLTESTQQGSGRLCATLQLQTKLPCPSVNLSVSEDVQLNPEKWRLESLSLKVEKTCSFKVSKQDEQCQHFPEGFYANIPINSINTQSEFLCSCSKLHIRHRRTPTFTDFSNKHLVDDPKGPNNKPYWRKKWNSANDYRKNVKKNNNTPRKQSFMDRKDFNQKFTRNFKIKASNNRILFRSENRMKIYDVTDNGSDIEIEERFDHAVVDLDNNDQPIHFEPVSEEFSEPLGKMKPGDTLSIKRVNGPSRVSNTWRGGVQKFAEVAEPVAEGEDLAMSVIGPASAATQATLFASITQFLTLFFI
ncbi:uncharacterized protein [Pseudorasbora parva]|uniref:uncharacterized protein n=1 Tax=Pseudorasbora parva TaxID=51549 RepID=UPI00351DD984